MTDIAEFLLARYDEHIARAWQRGAEPGSAFVRDEYESLKRVVAEHKRDPRDLGFPMCNCCAGGGGFGAPWPCPTLRLLAEPYSDHQDYDESWRP